MNMSIMIYHDHANHGDAEVCIVKIQVALHVFKNTNCLTTRHFPQRMHHLPSANPLSQFMHHHS